MKLLVAAIATLAYAMSSVAADSDFQRKKEAIELIDSSSNNLCLGILKSKSLNYALSVDAKAELAGLIKKLAGLGFSGAASVSGKNAEGPLQEDLVKVLNPQVMSEILKCVTTTSEARTRLLLGDVPPAVLKLDPLQEAQKFQADVRADGLRIAAALRWKAPLSKECQAFKSAHEGYASNQPPMQTAFPESEKEMVRQRVLESALSMRTMTNSYVWGAKQNGCLDNPNDFNPVPPRR